MEINELEDFNASEIFHFKYAPNTTVEVEHIF